MCWEDGQDSMHIFGTKGSIGFPSMTFYTYPDEEHWGWFQPLVHEQIPVELNDPMQSELDHFFDLCLGRETVPRCTGEQGLKTLKMVNAIIESANTGQVVTID
jgi:predicted dehydrogenase